ncbi:TetR family transcriptional regulator [Cobetia marina]|nr:TetR family transcriptional regulator [Cobetia marina]
MTNKPIKEHSMTHLSAKPKTREEIKAWHRLKIIEATIDVVSQYGLAGTTITRVVEAADVSRGMINVHFRSKNRLLIETAEYMGELYKNIRKTALLQPNEKPVDKIKACIYNDFSENVLNKRVVGFWLALRSQVKSLPEIMPYVDTRDNFLKNDLLRLFQELESEATELNNKEMVVDGIMAMLEGYWIDYYLHPEEFDRAKAIETVILFLSLSFPAQFNN